MNSKFEKILKQIKERSISNVYAVLHSDMRNPKCAAMADDIIGNELWLELLLRGNGKPDAQLLGVLATPYKRSK